MALLALTYLPLDRPMQRRFRLARRRRRAARGARGDAKALHELVWSPEPTRRVTVMLPLPFLEAGGCFAGSWRLGPDRTRSPRPVEARSS